MKKWFSLLLVVCACTSVRSQTALENYLSAHHYAFSLATGPDHVLSDTLARKLRNYRLVLQAEGGSHYLTLYHELPLMWLRFLNRRLGVTHFFFEYGHAADMLSNRYLDTGDTSWWYHGYRGHIPFWADLLTYNASLPEQSRVHSIGIDFERPFAYLKALRLLLPSAQPPEALRPAFDAIPKTADTLADCAALVQLNAVLKKSLLANRDAYKSYLGSSYEDFEKIVLNPGSCRDVFKNRNDHMAASFLGFDARLHDSIYYGELGQAHTVLLNRNVGSLLNKAPGFKDKVCVVNLYCDQCTTPEEPVSNWTLKKIEPDIRRYFLPLCTGDFTLFDLSDPDPAIERFRAYGQFLIVARKQR